METKICTKCKLELEISNFRIVNNSLLTQCKRCISNYKKEYYQKNSKKIIENSANNYLKNKEAKALYDKVYRKQNLAIRSEYRRNYYKENKVKELELSKTYRRNRRKNDVQFKLTTDIRTMINKSFNNKGHKKNSRTYEILGCTFTEFKEHLEKRFEIWMNWRNYGNWNGIPTEPNTAWDIDHINPITNAQTMDETIKLNHFTNLQPLCSYNNRWIKKDN